MATSEQPTSIRFDGNATPELEAWLGDNLGQWLPDEHAVIIRFNDGFEATCHAGDELRHNVSTGLIEIWPA